MTRQVHNCVQVSRRYLSFLRERAENQPPVGVNQILMDLGELLKSNPDAQRNDLKIHLLADDLVARVNGTDLMQVLLNLIVNALQCTPEHHRVEIFGQRLLSPFDLSQLVDGPEARFINRDGFDNTPPLLAISVQDDGPGIPAEVTPKIFDTYFTTKPSGGTGLGLSIVQRLVREARGCIHLHTKPGHGTTFTVYLPASTATPDRNGA
jgi:signal transduction histidine kinase